MDWVKIEQGCEMPEENEIVIVSDGEDWRIASYIGGEFYPVDEDEYVCVSEALDGSEYWARPKLPNN